MEEGTAKRYYKKINTTFEGVNRLDDFAKQYLNLLESSKLDLYQKERREIRIFDDSWLSNIEGIIPVFDRLTRAPKETLKKVSEVVPVERAKKIDSNTIRHLAANTQNIKKTNKGGDIQPTKLLASYSEQELGTYENRFLMTLVDKIYTFIEIRYKLINNKMSTEYVNYLKVSSTVEYQSANIDYDIHLRINRNMEDDVVCKKNQELFDRMKQLRENIANYKNCSFMRQMSGYPPVRPPIMKTNIIMKNIEFSQCYDLWLFLDTVDRIGYEVDILERDVDFDEEYIRQIENTMMVLYATVANNQIEEFALSHEKPFAYRKAKMPRILKKVDEDEYLEAAEYVFKDETLNQYFLDQIKKDNIQRYNTLMEAGIPKDKSIDIIHKKLLEIADGAFQDFINYTFNPEDEKDLKKKIEIQNEIVKAYREIEKVKRENLKDIETKKALAMLELNTLRDDLKNREAMKKAEIEAKKAEERRLELLRKKAIAQEKLAKKKKINRAKELLEKAERARQMQNK
ncbi:MAG: DUF2357 domain-containing protein [Candidatus Izemoplasmatales bacterium]|nr:DUF2357 domain-containing protein [Candidatus Izemoplasmatales bacterium]